MICQRGSARIGVFARDGPHAADIVLRAGDLVLLHEGHSVETLEDGTRLIEIKQGPDASRSARRQRSRPDRTRGDLNDPGRKLEITAIAVAGSPIIDRG